MHDYKYFKYFNFSNIFPITDFKIGEEKELIVSSPSNAFIKILKERLEEIGEIKIKNYRFEINKLKTFKLNISKKYIASTPIVLYKDNKKGIFFSIKKGDPIEFFIERITDNLRKKYELFFNKKMEMDEPLFDLIKIKKSVTIHLKKRGKEFIFIGTIAEFYLEYFRKRKSGIYRFMMETGLGEKNSLGFGFINPIRLGKNT